MLNDFVTISDSTLLYTLDLLGTFAFAIAGWYKAHSRWLNIFAVIILWIITAVWWWTVRDLILWRTPLFYITDINYFITAVSAWIIAYIIPSMVKKAYSIFRFVDSIWLAAFVIIWTNAAVFTLYWNYTDNLLSIWLISIILWMITWVGWWIIRDSVMWDVPFCFKKNANYITAAFMWALIYFLSIFFHASWWIILSFFVTMIYREIVSEYGVWRKVFRN